MQIKERSEAFHSVPTESGPGTWESGTTSSLNRGEGLVMDIYLSEVGKTAMMSQPQEKAIFVQIAAYTQETEELGRQLSKLIGAFELDEINSLQQQMADLQGSQRPAAQSLLRRLDSCMACIRQLRHRVVKANLRLAICIAKKYQNQGLALLDLIQEANTGLMTAAEKFDYQRGVPFGTYASWWVQQAIVHALANQSRTIRLPAYMVETLRRVNRIRENFSHVHHREPSDEELAQLADITPVLASKLSHFATQSIPIDDTTEVGSAHTLTQALADPGLTSPEEKLLQQKMRDDIGEAIAGLPEREARILRLRYGFEDGRDHSLQEIGEMLDLSRERIRQLEKRALESLRHPKTSVRLREHLYA